MNKLNLHASQLHIFCYICFQSNVMIRNNFTQRQFAEKNVEPKDSLSEINSFWNEPLALSAGNRRVINSALYYYQQKAVLG